MVVATVVVTLTYPSSYTLRAQHNTTQYNRDVQAWPMHLCKHWPSFKGTKGPGNHCDQQGRRNALQSGGALSLRSEKSRHAGDGGRREQGEQSALFKCNDLFSKC